MYLSLFRILYDLGNNDVINYYGSKTVYSRALSTPRKFRVPKRRRHQCQNENVKQDGFWVGKDDSDDSDVTLICCF